MRHSRKTIKLGRKAEHRNLMLANQVCSLIEHQRIRTTLAKAKAARPIAEKMLTLAKRGDIHARRLAFAYLHQKSAVQKLFAEVGPRSANRSGGYCRIVKLGFRQSDASPMAYLELVDLAVVEETPQTPNKPTKPQKPAN